MPKKTAKKTNTIRASKENARKAKKLVAVLTSGKKIDETDTWFLNEFIDRTIGRLPTEAAYRRSRDRARNKK